MLMYQHLNDLRITQLFKMVFFSTVDPYAVPAYILPLNLILQTHYTHLKKNNTKKLATCKSDAKPNSSFPTGYLSRLHNPPS
jgi:hypothetical protein